MCTSRPRCKSAQKIEFTLERPRNFTDAINERSRLKNPGHSLYLESIVSVRLGRLFSAVVTAINTGAHISSTSHGHTSYGEGFRKKTENGGRGLIARRVEFRSIGPVENHGVS